VTTTEPDVGYVYSCRVPSAFPSGPEHIGPWVDTKNGTWDPATKVHVTGSVAWPNAEYSVTASGDERIITTNDLPSGGYTTGVFPIRKSDPAYEYGTNPNPITPTPVTYRLPRHPKPATQPSCLRQGPIGVLTNGVFLADALDASGRDAAAHEVQDRYGGHPNGHHFYHYHDVSAAVLNNATGKSTLIGYAMDGYGIYVERNENGSLPTNGDLGVCHGRVSTVMWNGTLQRIYHYDVTREYPYTVGCYHGTPVAHKSFGGTHDAP